ncbi:MAG: proton-translocating transhydrogenase family protein [Terriglobia bacterium]
MALFLSFEVIEKVPPLLHTPLMLFGDAKEMVQAVVAAFKEI